MIVVIENKIRQIAECAEWKVVTSKQYIFYLLLFKIDPTVKTGDI